MKAYKAKETVETLVTKISPYSIYVNVFGDELTGKLDVKNEKLKDLRIGDVVPVKINYLSKDKIVLEPEL